MLMCHLYAMLMCDMYAMLKGTINAVLGCDVYGGMNYSGWAVWLWPLSTQWSLNPFRR